MIKFFYCAWTIIEESEREQEGERARESKSYICSIIPLNGKGKQKEKRKSNFTNNPGVTVKAVQQNGGAPIAPRREVVHLCLLGWCKLAFSINSIFSNTSDCAGKGLRANTSMPCRARHTGGLLYRDVLFIVIDNHMKQMLKGRGIY